MSPTRVPCQVNRERDRTYGAQVECGSPSGWKFRAGAPHCSADSDGGGGVGCRWFSRSFVGEPNHVDQHGIRHTAEGDVNVGRGAFRPLADPLDATPHPAGAIVTQVDFLIDGKLAWTEMNSPYVYGSDDDGTNLGYLITTWLTPGRHSFTVRAIGESGHAVSNTVTARVAAAPKPPTSLRGIWTRTLTQQDITSAGLTQGPPTGPWQLVFDQVGAWELDPLGTGLGTEYAVTGKTINVYAPIQEAPCCSNGSGGTSRYGHHGLGGVDCNPSGPSTSYSWSARRHPDAHSDQRRLPEPRSDLGWRMDPSEPNASASLMCCRSRSLRT